MDFGSDRKLEASIAGVEGSHDEVVLIFPEMTRKYRAGYVHRVLSAHDPKAQSKKEAHQLVLRIASWNVKDADGSVLPISIESFESVPPELQERIILTVLQRIPAKSLRLVNSANK